MRTYIKLAEVGICTPNGRRRVRFIEWNGKITAPPDRPLEAFTTALVRRVEDMCCWSSRAAAEKDIEAAIRVLRDIKQNLSSPEQEGA